MRELTLRHEVYSRKCSTGRMKRSVADYHLDRMRAVRDTLTALEAHELRIRELGAGADVLAALGRLTPVCVRYSIAQQIEEVTQEIGTRRSVYFNQVRLRRMRPYDAEFHQARMLAVLRTLTWLRDRCAKPQGAAA